ncbi:hypothetical protein [Virgibacillus litoralis]|uniref:Uncharacterized protein n=1 Tax=Virgibacillus litoralis TaxID=578221 RepID=A0ABS4HFH1_9BACI|nr:hypothetical protein [Virgibacillus litoralis]MBP1949349.1 hypothetical protein [Virgibacillus litoralis]
MFTNIHVLNYSNVTSNETIKKYMNNFTEYLNQQNIHEFSINYNDKLYYEEVIKIIDRLIVSEYLIHNLDLSLMLNNTNNEVFAIIGEELPTENQWGDATDFIAVISCTLEKNIWHEIAHLIGANDHYDNNTQKALDICMDENCIMQHGKDEGVFCNRVIDEIKKHLKNIDG